VVCDLLRNVISNFAAQNVCQLLTNLLTNIPTNSAEQSPSDKPAVSQLVKKFNTLYEPKDSLTCSEDTTTVPYIGPDKLIVSPHPHTFFFNLHYNITFPSAPTSSLWSLSLCFPTKLCTHFYSLPRAKIQCRLWHLNSIICDSLSRLLTRLLEPRNTAR
jgi:hypothetical protein